MSLATYRKKRHFKETPEPEGGRPSRMSDLRFVVQKHQASHLHFDFRLELDGVLKSWAVPKGPSLNPGDKRLAMMVEDHPFDYRTFEGTIPPGNYGAGTVMVWDEGTYHAVDAESREDSERIMREGLVRGRLSFVLEGHKLRGEFSLIKLHRGQKNAWLLIKKQDDFAEPDGQMDDHSVLTGRSMDEITEGVRPKRSAKPHTNGKLKHAEREDRHSRAERGNKKKRPARAKVTFVKPMLATLVDAPFDRDDWFFDVKWDGYRAIAEIQDGDVRLYSRNEKSFNSTYAPIVASLEKLGHDAILDGEIVVLDENGISQFQLLQNYQRTGEGRLIYYVFDLLELDGEDLREQPLRERKKKLAKILKRIKNVVLSDHIEREGMAFFDATAKRGLEGIIAKNASSRYRESVRSLDWLKIKTHRRQEAVIGGYTQPKGARKDFGSLVLGVYEGDDLVYIGHTGGGFDTRGLSDMRKRLEPLRQKTCPFKRCPKTNTPAQWVEPKLVCEVNFQEWTSDGHMRQPIFVCLREDKDPHSVHREDQLPIQAATKTGTAHSTRGESVASNNGRVNLTHLDKIYWPDEGYTKGDLINYYREIASFMLPYLKDRPESLNRHPNGIAGKNFFQKDVSRQPPPEWVETVSIEREERGGTMTVPLCQNEETLLYLANLGCIEINPWNSRINSLEFPDYFVLDLDPEDAPFNQVVEAALAVRKVLEHAGIESVCKTSGKTGLHIYVPLAAKYEYEPVRQFAELIANLAHRELPDSTSLVRQPKHRQGKVYLDFLQNSRGQTLAAPYSVRPHPAATVSTPLKWSEVTRRLDPSRFTIRTVPKRLDKVGDLWKPAIGKGIDLEKCLERLSG